MNEIRPRLGVILLFLILITILNPIACEISAKTKDEYMKNPIEFVIDGDTVEGVFYAADNPKYTVLLLQGFPGTPDDVLGLGKKLASSGINAMTFNYRGTCASTGTYSLSNSQQDIREAWRFLHNHENVGKYSIDTSNLVLGGYSFGGGMGLTFAANNDDVRRVFSIAGTDHGEFARLYASDPGYAAIFDSLFKQLEAPEGPVHFVGKEALTELQVNAKKYDLRLAANRLSKKDLLLIGGLDDENVTLEEYLLPLYRALKENGSTNTNLQFQILPGDHSFSDSREELFKLVDSWIKNQAIR